MTNKQSVAVVGLGWLGLPLAKTLLGRGHAVKGSTTSAEKAMWIAGQGIETQVLKLTPAPTVELDWMLTADVVVINIPPKAGQQGDTFHPEQITFLVDAIRTSSVKHIIYVSSTSVYPEVNRIVVEEDVEQASQSAAPALVDAEQTIRTLESGRLVTILRCGGLMGYDRIPGKYVAGRTVESGAVPVNYLHRDDAVGLLVTIIEQSLSGTFNAVAPEHPIREAVYRKSCADFNVEMPTFIEPAKPVSYKTVSSQKISQATNYEFQYPNPLFFQYGL